jgi:ketosteroid isomerase-like protein
MESSEIRGIEEIFWRSAGDRDTYAAHLAPDAIHVFPGWGIADRETVLMGVADACPWDTFEIADPTIVRLSRTSAAIVYTARARRAGEEYEAAITSVYRVRAGKWELVLHQQTAVPTN